MVSQLHTQASRILYLKRKSGTQERGERGIIKIYRRIKSHRNQTAGHCK
jgi:hypothetical protein